MLAHVLHFSAAARVVEGVADVNPQTKKPTCPKTRMPKKEEEKRRGEAGNKLSEDWSRQLASFVGRRRRNFLWELNGVKVPFH